MKTILILLVAGCAWAQIQQPRLGVMLTGAGAPRAVFGVAGSVTLGEPLSAADSTSSPTSGATSSNSPPSGVVVSMGCARRLCLMKTDAALNSFAGSAAGSTPVVNAPAGPALFWFEGSTGNGNAGVSALVYFPRSRQLARWQNGQLSPVDFDVTGDILSIGETTDGTLQFVVRTPSGTWIVRSGDVMVESLEGPESAGPALLLHGGVLFTTQQELILRRPDQSELVFQLAPLEATEHDSTTVGLTHGLTTALTTASEPRPSRSGALQLNQIAFSWLGENYVQVRVRGSAGNYSNYALRVDLGHERLFLLPEPEPQP